MANCPSADTQHLHLLERRRPAGRWMCQPRTPSPFVQASLCACILLLHAGCCKPRWLPSPAGRILPCLSLATFPPAQRGSPLLGTPQDRAGDLSRAAAWCRQLRDDCGADPAPLTPLLPGNFGGSSDLAELCLLKAGGCQALHAEPGTALARSSPRAPTKTSTAAPFGPNLKAICGVGE